MTYTLEAFIKDAKSALANTDGPAGRDKVRILLEKLLTNQGFVDEAVGPVAPIGTRKLYEDKDLGFVVLAHCNPKPHKSPPHDHGSRYRKADRDGRLAGAPFRHRPRATDRVR